VLAHWQFVVQHNGSSAVVPDGCRDLIRHVDSSGRPRWFVSELATGVDWVPLCRGERFMGWRLQPAAQIDEKPLLAELDPPRDRDRAQP